MKIKMLITMPAAPDGIHVVSYLKDKEYKTGKDITENIAKIFIDNKYAEQIADEDPIPEKPKEAKSDDKKTKAFDKPPDNKGMRSRGA